MVIGPLLSGAGRISSGVDIGVCNALEAVLLGCIDALWGKEAGIHTLRGHVYRQSGRGYVGHLVVCVTFALQGASFTSIMLCSPKGWQSPAPS